MGLSGCADGGGLYVVEVIDAGCGTEADAGDDAGAEMVTPLPTATATQSAP